MSATPAKLPELTPSLKSWLEYARPIIAAALGEAKADDLLRYPTSLVAQPATPAVSAIKEILEYDRRLNEAEIVPTADHYNAVLGIALSVAQPGTSEE